MAIDPKQEGSAPTWEDIERAALYNPVLYAICRNVRAGHCTREEALIFAVLELCKSVDRLTGREIERLRNAPANPRLTLNTIQKGG